MKRFKNILFISEPSSDDSAALKRAVQLAQDNQASLTLAKVIDHLPSSTLLAQQPDADNHLIEHLLQDQQQLLQEMIEPYQSQLEIGCKLLVGTPFLEIIRQVLSAHHDLVIKTITDQSGIIRRLFGSQEMHLLRKCPCPVWLIKTGQDKAFNKVLAAVDVGDDLTAAEEETLLRLNTEILDLAASLSVMELGELHIVHAWDAAGEGILRSGRAAQPKEMVDTYVETVYRRHHSGLAALQSELKQHLGEASIDYVKPQTHLRKGPARAVIPDLAREIGADLVVMGTVARTGIAGLFIGNTAETIIDNLDCSLLAIKPPGFKTPVKA